MLHMMNLSILLLIFNALHIQGRTVLNTHHINETYQLPTVILKGSYEKCPEGDECEFPFKCADQGSKEKNVCLRDKCEDDSQCKYPLKCLFAETGEGDVCSLKSCVRPSDCEYPYQCLGFGGQTGRMCTRKQCSDDTDCDYPLRCHVQTDGEKQVCDLRRCAKAEDCDYPLKCVDKGSWEGQVCTYAKCSNNGDCAYPLRCVKDKRYGNVCSKMCTNDVDCKNGGKCEDNKICACKSGLYGDRCEQVFDCSSEGKYKGCESSGGNCFYNGNQTVCECPDSKNYHGTEHICKDTETTTLTTTDSFSVKTKIFMSTVPTCYCGSATKSCYLDSFGDKHCSCFSGYAPVNGYCAAVCSEDKCVHGKCEIVGNNFKCRCNEGFTGKRCEDIFQTKSDKQDLWKILQVALMFAIFVLLSVMFCFLARIKTKH